MKRYRILQFDFDSRVRTLTDVIRDEWEDHIKELNRRNQQQIAQGLIDSYGVQFCDAKRQNFIDLGNKPMSILAFHNRFFEQIRTAFVMGAYYPSLTAACALGERILNYLILVIRQDYRSTPEYKKVYRKESFDNWDVPIDTLESWGVLIPDAAKAFRDLKDMRHKAVHFRPEVDQNDRELAIEAIKCLRGIIATQFSAFGPQPWFIKNIPGEIYIKRDCEDQPFIKNIYLPNCLHVGPKHRIETLIPKVVVNDDFEYEDREIPDDEFSEMRNNRRTSAKPC